MLYTSTILSGGISLAVLAGIVTGIFYLVVSGLKYAGRLRAALQEEEARRQNGIPPGSCVVCGRPPDALKEGPEAVGCSDCGGNTCKEDGCSRRSSIGWRCVLCSVKRDLKKTSGTWFNQKSGSEQIDDEKTIDNETIQIREFIEKLVETIVGGPLDRVTVGKLSTHSAYLGLFAKYHGSLCQGLARLGFVLQLSIANKTGSEFDSPSSAHAALKQLIQKIVHEAMALPDLKQVLKPSSNGTNGILTEEEEDFSNKSYEDILATAILNKIIERFQQNGRRYEGVDKNSNVVTGSNSVGSGGSLHDEDLHSNSDWSDTSRTEPLSLTIEEHIEEVTTTYESSEEGDENGDVAQVDTEVKLNRRVPFPESGRVILEGTDDDENSESEEVHSSATELVTSTNSWEENWLFQKKRLRSTPSAHHPVPVPMLVPNPSQEYRALIGGVDADDLSDMSDCSDSVLEDVVMADDDPKNSTHDSSNNHLESNETFERNGSDDSKSESEEKKTEETENPEVNSESVDKEVYSDERVNGNGSAETEEDSNNLLTPPDSLNSESSPQSLSQKDREFSVDYDIVHQIDVPAPKPPVPKPRSLDLINNEHSVSEKPPKCPIAEREKEKWKNAIELPDNPYSPENIAKREQKRNDYFRTSFAIAQSVDFPDEDSTDFSMKDEFDNPRYSRDYYVKASRSPTGDPNYRSTSSQQSETSEECPSTNETETTKESPAETKTEKKEKMHRRKDVRVLVRSRAVDKTDLVLPSVKELAKQFAKEEIGPGERRNSRQKVKTSQSMSKGDYKSPRDEREYEVDYSILPVSQIISNLVENSKEKPRQEKRKEINGKKEERDEPVFHLVRFNGKQVHSLTARSISKEFREGLKKNNYHPRMAKIDRGSSGESDHGEIYSGADNDRPPTPPIDLKSKKKFWEDIISNSSK